MKRLASLLLLLVFVLPASAQTSIPRDVPLPQELIGVQAPIPMEWRFYNRTGHQCVWVTIEALAKQNGSETAQGISQTYLGEADPMPVEIALKQRKVKFQQTTNRDKVLDFIEYWVTHNGRAVGINVYGNSHMLTLVHFERGTCVKVFDNGEDMSIQTWNWKQFQNRFCGWAIVILPDDYPTELLQANDIVQAYNNSFNAPRRVFFLRRVR